MIGPSPPLGPSVRVVAAHVRGGRREKLILSTALSWLLLSACAATTPATPVPGAEERAAWEAELRALIAATEDAAERRDIETYREYYHPDVALLMLHGPITYGLGRSSERGFPDDYHVVMHTEGIGISAAGDMAYAFGTYEMTAPDERTGELMDSTGKWMSVFGRKSDGSWGAIVDTYNVDTAVPAVR